jgi:hypothetical protein
MADPGHLKINCLMNGPLSQLFTALVNFYHLGGRDLFVSAGIDLKFKTIMQMTLQKN